MANKRIELEHYKYFVQLGEEEPNRKRVTSGAYISIITVMVMLVFFMVLGMLSATLAKNPKNVLEKLEPAMETTTVGGIATDKDLTAQAELTIPDTGTGEQVEISTLPTDTSTSTVPSDETTTKKRTGPSKQSKGIGNLANLAKLAGGRGLQLYVLIITLGLIILLYFPLKRIRQQRKAP